MMRCRATQLQRVTGNIVICAGYTTGGAIHVIINNQAGFTTLPGEGRSSWHAADTAKAVRAPIWHVNAGMSSAAEPRLCPMALCISLALVVKSRSLVRAQLHGSRQIVAKAQLGSLLVAQL